MKMNDLVIEYVIKRIKLSKLSILSLKIRLAHNLWMVTLWVNIVNAQLLAVSNDLCTESKEQRRSSKK